MFSLMGLKYLYIISRLMEFFLSISYWVDLLSYHILNFILFLYIIFQRGTCIFLFYILKEFVESPILFLAQMVLPYFACTLNMNAVYLSFCWSRSYWYINHSKLPMKRCHLYQFLQKTPFSEERAWRCLIRNYKCKVYCLRMCTDITEVKHRAILKFVCLEFNLLSFYIILHY